MIRTGVRVEVEEEKLVVYRPLHSIFESGRPGIHAYPVFQSHWFFPLSQSEWRLRA
jgi:hypothetical protein